MNRFLTKDVYMRGLAFQDYLKKNFCWCCGTWNHFGLRIKSFWDEANPEIAVCEWLPSPWHCAGSGMMRSKLNGGIMLTLIDGHSVCTALADAYRREGREIGLCPKIWYVTGEFGKVRFLLPTPLGAPVLLRARVKNVSDRKTLVECRLFSEGIERVTPVEVLAIRKDSLGKE